MVEIYSYDITTHEQFARNQQQVEAFRKQYHVPRTGARFAFDQTKILDFVPKHPAIVMLMQTYQRKMWARFIIPKNYYLQRFASSYIAPSLGSNAMQDADINRLEAFLKQKTKGRFDRKELQVETEKPTGEERQMIEEGKTLINLLEGVKQTNEMVDFVYARMHQFVQA